MIEGTPANEAEVNPEFALLGFLVAGPAHGYELHRKLTQELGELWHARLAHVYNVLKRLEAQGLISGQLRMARNTGYPAQRRFQLTVLGRQQFDAWLNKPCSTSLRAVRLEFLARLYFSQQRGLGQARALIAQQRMALQDTTTQFKHALADLPPDNVFARLALELRHAQATAILVWLDSCERHLKPRRAKARR